MMTNGQAIHTVIRGLSALAPLTQEEEATVYSLSRRTIDLPPGCEVDRHLSRSSEVALVFSGWACEQREMADGRRQIFSILLPGDLVDVRTEQNSLTTLTSVRVADAAPLVGAMPLGGDSVQRVQLSQKLRTERLFDHLTRLGHMNAYERTSHLLLELHGRLRVLGLVNDGSFLMPMSQEVVGGVLGLTTVHVNRTFKQLRADGFITSSRGTISLHKLGRLGKIADYSSPLSYERTLQDNRPNEAMRQITAPI
jgi:CRP-like cAMP-binding protein